jgi:hypothetical protein
MDTTTAPLTAYPISAPTSSRRVDVGRFVATLLLGAAMGAMLTIAVGVQVRLSPATAPVAGTAVTDGWAHSPITRGGSADVAAGVAITDGWAHSPITRGGSADVAAGVAITDGWAHSPITREGGSDARAAMLRQLAASYEAQGPAAEARSR